MRWAVAGVLGVVLMTGCSREPSPPTQGAAGLRDIALHPERYAIGERVDVSGWLIRPPQSALFVCDRLGGETAPAATGSCVQVENEDLLDEGGASRLGGTRWVPGRVDLDCRVKRYLPADVRPERLSLTCEFG